MEEARTGLERRYAEALGPKAPPCGAGLSCRPFGDPEPSTGVVLVPGLGPVPVCSPLRCGFTVAGSLLASATWTPHPPGKYRKGAP